MSADIFRHAYSLISPEQKKKEWHEEIEEQVCSYFPSMTFQQRLSGCVIFMTLGFLISMGSTFRLVALLKGDPEPFATSYSALYITACLLTYFS